ncbi:MAG: cupin domain-containing protein [Chromatiales bacterium]|jgi:mannose-6-phosphate isomerase-like protein (cupin superfamily)|nr:cupin domain-containing protein [Chromatiales bacterium]
MPNSDFKQSLLITHVEDTDFEAMEANNGAPRPQFLYRHLGVDEATGGAYDAHVIRGVAGSKPPIAEHKHTELDLLFVYVLKGWMSFHYVGHEEHKLSAGDCHVIPPGLSHTVTGWSDDVELLEITSPGQYKTINTINGEDLANAAT